MQPAGQLAATRDRDIRVALERWLLSKQHNSPVRIIHEFPIPRPSARIDLALINGRISGYEIKSDVDSLTRLPSQLGSYGKIFEQLCVVTTPKKSRTVLENTPSWCGVLCYSDEGKFKTLRKLKLNPNVDIECLLYSLSKKELLKIAATASLNYVKTKNLKSEIISEIINNASRRSIIKNCRYQLKNR
jgi:hypothetical protein